MAAETGLAHVSGLCGLTYVLPAVGRAAEARALGDDTVAAARTRGMSSSLPTRWPDMAGRSP